VNRRLKTTLAAAALLLISAHAAAGGDARGVPTRPPHGAVAVRTAPGRRTPMSQTGSTRGRRTRASDALTPGVWGGDHIRFEVTERGASVEYDCAHGTVEGRIVVGRDGRFSVTGMHYEEHGGPVRAGEDEVSYPVRLSGVVGGSLMKLTVTRAGTRRVVGTFSLARDREANLVKCR
jgi:hypothetical protein